MRALSAAAGSDHHAAMLSDENSVLLEVRGDSETLGNPNFPSAGSLLSEATAGANGVGTTVAEAKYIELIGHEHFIRGFHPFTCQGVPIRNTKGQMIGSISTSVRKPEASRRLRDIFLCAAHGIESELMHNEIQSSMIGTIKAREDEESLDKLRQDIIQAQASSRLKIQLASKMLSTKAEYAINLIKAAQDAMEKFKLEAKLWREMAESDQGYLESFSITGVIEQLLALLRTELSLKGATIQWKWKDEVSTLGFRKPMTRNLLSVFLEEIRKSDGNLQVGVRASKDQTRLMIGSYVQIFARKTPESLPRPLQ